MLEDPATDIEAYDQMGWRAIHRAVWGGHIDLLSKLLAKKADVNVCDMEEVQPLHIAAARGLEDACKLLLDAGANAGVPDVQGLRPCDYAMPHEALKPLFAKL